MSQTLAHVSILVADYDAAIGFYVETLGFELIEDSYQPEQDKRWVVVRPSGGGASLVLAQPSSPEQDAFVGNQAGGRVMLFLRTDDFWRDHALYVERGVDFVREPVVQPYGTVAVFKDLYGNLWDLIEFSDGRP